MGEELGAYAGGHDDFGGDFDGYVGDDIGRRQPQHRPRQQSHMSTLEQPLPIPETLLTAAQTVDINAFPQRGFKPNRLVVPSTLGPLFKINDIKVGQETQFVGTGVIYCECFSEVAVAVFLKGTPARLGNNIVLTVTNSDANNSQTFSAMLMGFTETN